MHRPAFRAPILGVSIYYAITESNLSPEEEFAMCGGRELQTGTEGLAGERRLGGRFRSSSDKNRHECRDRICHGGARSIRLRRASTPREVLHGNRLILRSRLEGVAG